MQLLTTRPPRPSWYGSHDPDLTAKYIAFVRRHLHAMCEGRCKEIESKISSLEADNQRYTAHLARQSELKQQLAAMEARLWNSESRAKQLQEAAAALQSLPHVVGARPDSKGYLVVHLRLIDNETDRHQGDFEMSIATSTWNGRTYIVLQKTRDSDYDVRLEAYRHRGGDKEGWQITIDTALRERFEAGDLAGVVQYVTDKISHNLTPFYWRDTPSAASIPDPTWTGIMPGLADIIAKTLEQIVNTYVKQEMESIQEKIRQLGRTVDRIRENHKQLRSLKAELKQLSKYKDEKVELDKAERREELRYITSLEGVMGMRFNDEGIPVFHIRTSTIYKGDRYDLGDFEITFALNDERLGVLKIAKTRGGKGPYYHPEYSIDDWFCFGHRADTLADLFRKGQFDTLMHTLINTMNFVNPGDRSSIPHWYQRIPMDCVWTPPKKRSRRRRRGTHLQTA